MGERNIRTFYESLACEDAYMAIIIGNIGQ